MKKSVYVILLSAAFLAGNTAYGQMNINNPGFENWQNMGSANEEPNDWSSFKTASGTYALFAQQQVKRSSLKRPGSTGTYSAVIWAKSISGTLANGNMTTGQVNMGDMTPSGSNNYNITHTSDANFNEVYTDDPDSIIFWTKFKPAGTGTTDSARVSAIIHNSYDYRDPNTSDGGAPAHIYSSAIKNFASTNGGWVRKAIAFNHSGPASSAAYILITFTTNKTPGSGTAGDSLYVDDISFSYNTTGIDKKNETNSNVSVYNDLDSRRLVLDMNFDRVLMTRISILNSIGQTIRSSSKEIGVSREYISLEDLNPGVFFVHVVRADGKAFAQKFFVR